MMTQVCYQNSDNPLPARMILKIKIKSSLLILYTYVCISFVNQLFKMNDLKKENYTILLMEDLSKRTFC